MKLVLCGMAGAILSMPAMAGVISYGELEYETVDWISSPDAGLGASGTVGGIGVSFISAGITGEPVSAYDFSSDPSFDALSFDSEISESITVFGGIEGLSSLSFDQEVISVLILIGAPGNYSGPTHFGSSIWDFDDALELSIVDGDGFVVGEDNAVSNPGWGPTTQTSGVIGISGEGFSLLEWMQSTDNGVDKLQVTIAVATNPIPAPAGALALLVPAVFGMRRRR